MLHAIGIPNYPLGGVLGLLWFFKWRKQQKQSAKTTERQCEAMSKRDAGRAKFAHVLLV
jgi:hypothetical protein